MRWPRFIPFLLLALALPPVSRADNAPPPDIQQAQAKVWDLQSQLYDAKYRLAIARIDSDKGHEISEMNRATQAKDFKRAGDCQSKIAKLDHRRELENQRLQLNHQLLQAQQAGDKGQQEQLKAQLKGLR